VIDAENDFAKSKFTPEEDDFYYLLNKNLNLCYDITWNGYTVYNVLLTNSLG
tara:strand:+ start:402 stop:557 length:156 start_codon:yes stop_codon:yes gene_type:complete